MELRSTSGAEKYELMGRIVVCAGIFLLLLFGGHVLHEPTRETVQSWITSDQLYERTVEQTAAWIASRLE